MQGLVIYLGRELRQLVRLGVYPTKGLQLREVLVAAKREFREAVIREKKVFFVKSLHIMLTTTPRHH